MNATSIQTLEDARRFWDEYNSKRQVLMLSDAEAESAFRTNPHRYEKWEREFWDSAYTPEIHAALKVFGQEYRD